MKSAFAFLSLAILLAAGTVATAGAPAPTARVAADECPGTYEDGLAAGQADRASLIAQYGNGTPAYITAHDAAVADALEQFQNASRECRQYWRGVLDGL